VGWVGGELPPVLGLPRGSRLLGLAETNKKLARLRGLPGRGRSVLEGLVMEILSNVLAYFALVGIIYLLMGFWS
jgi:hypothetical protein